MNVANRATRRRSAWRTCLQLSRMSNLPTVVTNCLAGAALAGPAPPASAVAAAALALSLFYTGGMFLNDAFDWRYDRLFRPDRPIPSGDIQPKRVFRAGFTFLIAGEGLLVLLAFGENGPRWAAPALGLVLGLLIVYYNYRHKENPLSPLVMALCRAMVYLIAASVVSDSPLSPAVVSGAALLTAYIAGLTYVAKQENLREVKNLWPLALLFAPFLPAVLRAPGFHRLGLIYIFFLAWVLYTVSQLLRRERDIPRAVIRSIAGISLLDGMLMANAAAGAAWQWMAVAGWLLTLSLQRHVAGT